MPVGAIGSAITVEAVALAGSIGATELNIAITLQTVADALVATPAGSQTTSLALTAKANRIITVASAGDGVRLPPAIAGSSLSIRNGAGANACNVFPASAAQGGVAGGDAINALAVNAAFSLTVAAGTTTFRCYTTGTWITG